MPIFLGSRDRLLICRYATLYEKRRLLAFDESLQLRGEIAFADSAIRLARIIKSRCHSRS
jgi:hypothetical protein